MRKRGRGGKRRENNKEIGRGGAERGQGRWKG